MAHGRDVYFVAAVPDELGERLRARPVAMSLEMGGSGVAPRPDERGVVLPGWMPASGYRGRYGPGWTLEAVAILRDGHPPAGRGSAMWVES